MLHDLQRFGKKKPSNKKKGPRMVRRSVRSHIHSVEAKGTYFIDVNQNLAYLNLPIVNLFLLITNNKNQLLTDPPLPLLVDVNKVRSLRPGAGALLGHK